MTNDLSDYSMFVTVDTHSRPGHTCDLCCLWRGAVLLLDLPLSVFSRGLTLALPCQDRRAEWDIHVGEVAGNKAGGRSSTETRPVRSPAKLEQV